MRSRPFLVSGLMPGWLERQAEFLALARENGELQATLSDPDVVSLERENRSLASLERERTPDLAAAALQRANDLRACLTLDPNFHLRQWSLDGGSDLSRRQFAVLAFDAAVQAGIVAASATEDEGVDAWMEAIRAARIGVQMMGSDYGRMPEVCRSSSLLCRVLSSGARVVSVPVDVPSVRQTKDTALSLVPRPAVPETLTPVKPRAARQDDVDAFLDRVRRVVGGRPRETYIWETICHYDDDTQYRQWKKGKLNPRSPAALAFEAALKTADADLPAVPRLRRLGRSAS